MSKTLASFRLSEITKQNLKYLAEKHKLSQAELIENMCDFVDRPELDYDFMLAINAWRTEKNPAFKKFKKEYDRASISEQKIMWQKLTENNFELENFKIE